MNEKTRACAANALYEAALAFPNQNYLPWATQMETLVERLRAVASKGPAIEHRVTAVFSAASAWVPWL